MIKPLLHRVLIKPDTLDSDPLFAAAKKAGIALPEHDAIKMEQNRVDTGTVVKIGPSAFRAFMKEADITELPVNVGDRVSFAKYSGKVMMDGDEKYIVLNDDDCIAVLGDE